MRTAFLLLGLFCFTFLPLTALAQDEESDDEYEFEEDSGYEFTEEESTDDGTEEITDDFLSDENGDNSEGNEGDPLDVLDEPNEMSFDTLPMATGLIVESDVVDSDLSEYLTGIMLTKAQELNKVEIVQPDELKVRFNSMGPSLAAECAFDPICISRIGQELGFEKLIMGRITEGSSNTNTDSYAITIDLIDIEQSIVENYFYQETSGDVDAIQEIIESGMYKLFDQQTEVPTHDPDGDKKKGLSTLQLVFASGAMGLGVIFGVVGIVKGAQASSLEDDLKNTPLRDDMAYTITQVDAQTRLDDAKKSALISNVFYGLAVAAIGTSLLLFLLRPGSNIATEEELEDDYDIIHDLYITPGVGPAGAGIVTGFSF